MNTGGPAFPVTNYVNVEGETWESNIQGMTLRDYFAAGAMQSILSLGVNSNNFDSEASIAYQMADAMLKARME